MVLLDIKQHNLVIQVLGLDRLWALKRRLVVPLEHIQSVYHDPRVFRASWRKGVRFPGTSIPGVIAAGTFYRRGQKTFWDVKRGEKAIVLELAGDKYDRIIVEVVNPDQAVRCVSTALKTCGRGRRPDRNG